MVGKDDVSVNSYLVPRASQSNPRYSVLIGLAVIKFSIEGGEGRGGKVKFVEIIFRETHYLKKISPVPVRTFGDFFLRNCFGHFFD